jgi:predicted MFS family arabinose efflux permease
MSTSDLSAEVPAPASEAVNALRRTTLIALVAYLTVVDLFAPQAILPSLTKAYGVSPAMMSLAVNACTLGMAIASFATALLSTRIDRRRGIVTSLALLAVPTLLLAVAPSLASFAVLRVTQGLFMASAFTLTLAHLGETCSAKDAAGAFAAYITGNVASNLFGRLMSAAIADHFGLAANFAVFAGLNLAGAALVSLAFRGGAMAQSRAVPSHPLQAVALHLSNRALRAAFAIGFCILFAFIGTFTYVNFVLVQPPLGLGMMALGFVYFVFLPSIVTTLLMGGLVSRFDTRAGLWGGLAVAAAGLPLLLAAHLSLVVFGLGLVAVGTFAAQAVATGFVGRTALSERGAASGIYLASYFSGGLVGTAVLGQLFGSLGWTACVIGIGASLALAAVLTRQLRPVRMIPPEQKLL